MDFLFVFLVWRKAIFSGLDRREKIIFNTSPNYIFLAEIVQGEMQFYVLSRKCEKSVVIVYVGLSIYVLVFLCEVVV